MVEDQGLGPPITNSRIRIGNRSGEFVVIHIQVSKVDPSKTDVYRQRASELVSSEIGKGNITEPEVGNGSGQFVRIQVQEL